jgi:hypothetical protein
MTPETMNTALAAASLCWSDLAGGPRLVDAGDAAKRPSPDARNAETLMAYVGLATRKGKTETEIAAALRANYDGDAGPLETILSAPDVPDV